jgi:hypothetical protein
VRLTLGSEWPLLLRCLRFGSGGWVSTPMTRIQGFSDQQVCAGKFVHSWLV